MLDRIFWTLTVAVVASTGMVAEDGGEVDNIELGKNTKDNLLLIWVNL